MSKKGNTRSRRRSLRIWGGYLLVLMAWVVAVMALAFLGFIICASITWQPSPLYDFLNWVRDYIVLVCIVTVLAGWVVISFYFISKPIKQLDVVANAAEQLSRPSEEPIQLPDSLEDISIQLNLAREQALRDARAAREAEQRKNDLIVYLAHDLKTPLTSMIGYADLLRGGELPPENQRRAADGHAVDRQMPGSGQQDHHQHGGKAPQQGEDQGVHVPGKHRPQQTPACQNQQRLSGTKGVQGEYRHNISKAQLDAGDGNGQR